MADLPHFTSSAPVGSPGDGPWYRGLTRYHWFVLIVAALGWLFDCLDQQLFNLARKPAMETLLATADAAADPKAVDFFGGLSTCIFLAGWATGGLIFGVVGDRIGRAKTMMITILIYSLCRRCRRASGTSPSTGSSQAWAWGGSSPWAWRWWRR
jgi:MFS family permease